MSRVALLLPMLLAFCSCPAGAQSAAAPPPVVTVSSTVRPALSQVAQTLNSVNVRRWKAPNPVRSDAAADIDSIQRDLSGTLAGLLQQADAAPGSVPAAFAVYRNVDALYDTLLRVVETADLAAPDQEAGSLEATLKTLEEARSALGDAILSGAEMQQGELIRLRTLVTAAATAEHSHVRTTIVDDGPAPEHTRHHTTTHKTTKRTETKHSESSQSAPNSHP